LGREIFSRGSTQIRQIFGDLWLTYNVVSRAP
jgi:hypothetical protein